MSLRDELDAPRTNGGVCSVKTFVESQANPQEWIELIDDPDLQHSRIHRLMRKHGYPLTANPITRHRQGQCTCARPAG